MNKSDFVRAARTLAAEKPRPAPVEKPSLKGVIRKLTPPFLRPKQTFVRRFERYECCIIGELGIVNRFLALDGVILEVSQGGVLFRPASTHLLDRTGDAVKVTIDGQTYAGTIMSSRAIGYGIKLEQSIPSETIEELVLRYGLKLAA